MQEGSVTRGDLGSLPPQKNDSYDNIKVTWFFRPFVATKNTDKVVKNITCEDEEDTEHVMSKYFKRFHVSFHSTLLCNARTVNYLKDCKTSSMIRARGRFDNMRH